MVNVPLLGDNMEFLARGVQRTPVISPLCAIACTVTIVTYLGATIAHADTLPPTDKVPLVSVTPFSNVSNGFEDDAVKAKGSDFEDAYTRLYITTDHSKKVSNVIPYKARSYFYKYLFGKESSINLTLSVDTGEFKATVPLLTLYHKSDTAGEQWTRTVYSTAESFPLFLVGAGGENGTPTIKASLKGNLSGSSQVAGSTVNVVLGVTRAVAPESKIVTALSKTQLRNEADAVDTALSKLFDRAVDESTTVDQDLRYWHASGAMKISLEIPAPDFVLTTTGDQVGAGTWLVRFESPRPSIFVDWRICRAAKEDVGLLPIQLASIPADVRCQDTREGAIGEDRKEVDAAGVLATNLANFDNGLGQVGSYLAQQTWYKAAVPKLAASSQGKLTCKQTKGAMTCATDKPTIDDDAIGDFCRQIHTTARNVGLSTTDAAIVTWAVYKQNTDIPIAARAAMGTNAVCGEWIAPIEKAKGVRSAAPVPPVAPTANPKKIKGKPTAKAA